MSYQTRGKKVEFLQNWLKERIDVSTIRPRQNTKITINDESVYRLFCDEYQDFDLMLDEALFNLVQNHFAALSAKTKPDYVEGDERQILREKLSGRLKLNAYHTITHTIFLETVTSMQEINPNIEGIVVAFDAIIMFTDDPKSYVVGGEAYCASCKSGGEIKLRYDFSLKLPWCADCRQYMKLDPETAKSEFVQTLLLEEFPECSRNNTPVKFTAKLRGSLVGTVFIGKRKRFLGMFRSEIDTKRKENPVYIEILAVQDIEQSKECIITHVEAEKYRSAPNILDDLIESFAPHIKNRNLEKEAMLLSIISGIDDFDLRSRSHILLSGDPGTGKSELCKFLALIIPKGDIVDGNAVSQSGLVFGLDKLSSGKQVPKAGFAVLNNGGVLIIDEFDKCGKNERKSLHGVLEQGMARYNKIQAMKAPAVITMVACANPKFLTWKPELSLADNLEPIEKTILDRCDIIIRMKPIMDISKKAAQLESFISGISSEETKSPFDITTLKAYLAYARKIQPKLSQEASKVITDFYILMQKLEQPEGSLPMEQRQGEALVRLSLNRARLKLQHIVDEDTAKETIRFYKNCLETLGMKTDDVVTTIPLETAHMSMDETFWQAINNVVKDEHGRFNESDLIEELMKNHKFKNEGVAERYFQRMHEKSGKIIKERGKFRKI